MAGFRHSRPSSRLVPPPTPALPPGYDRVGASLWGSISRHILDFKIDVKVVPGAETPTGLTYYYVPHWARLIASVDPVNDEARRQALARAVVDPELRNAVETIYALALEATVGTGKSWLERNGRANRKVADYLMELWVPGKR